MKYRYSNNTDTSYAYQIGRELVESLSLEDTQLLREDLERLGLKQWYHWSDENQSEVNEYLAATAKQRERKKKWKDPVFRRRLCIAAYIDARMAVQMIEAASQLTGPCHLRSHTAFAASLARRVASEDIAYWPFDEVEPPAQWLPIPMQYYERHTVVLHADGSPSTVYVDKGYEHS